MKSARGFTLMEVLVALVLLTLFSLVTFRALDAVLKSQRQATAEMERWHELAAAFAWMNSDLSNAVARLDPQQPLGGGLHTQIAQDGSAQFDLLRLLPEDADQGLRRIGYHCVKGGLSRLVWPDADNILAAPREFALLPGLSSCAFRYLDEHGQWLPLWPPQARTPFPRAIELSIGMVDGTPIRRVLRVQ